MAPEGHEWTLISDTLIIYDKRYFGKTNIIFYKHIFDAINGYA